MHEAQKIEGMMLEEHWLVHRKPIRQIRRAYGGVRLHISQPAQNTRELMRMEMAESGTERSDVFFGSLFMGRQNEAGYKVFHVRRSV
jgi:hypothetical protein